MGVFAHLLFPKGAIGMNCFIINYLRRNLLFTTLVLLFILLVVHSFPLAAYASSSSQTISTSSSHTLAINSKGELFACGDNLYGGLGIGEATEIAHSTPLKVGTATNWTAVSAGYYFSLALNSKGELYAWGLNSSGQLGFSTGSIAVPTPTRVGTGTNWVAISAGTNHALALTSQGQLFAWGDNRYGQVGDGSTTNNYTPKQVSTVSNWTTISAGGCSSYAINSAGFLFAWGDNRFGQLGDGSTTNSMTPKRIGSTAINWVDVSGGMNHVLALTSQGEIYAWGDNFNGQLGDGTSIDSFTPVRSTAASDWVTIAAGAYYSFAINSKGELFAWGSNYYGQLGDTVLAYSSPPKRVTTPVADNWAAVSAGGSVSLMLKSSGELFACGSNGFGHTGNGATTGNAHFTPVLQLGAPNSVLAQQRITFITDTRAISTTRFAQNGTALGTLPTQPTREGYSFAGWWTAPIEGRQVSTTTLVRSDIILHARYVPLPPAPEPEPPAPILRTVTFNASGTTVHTRQVEQGKALGTLPAASVRTGQDFTGWFTQVSGGVQVQSTHLVTADMTLYARYVPKSYTLTFNSAGGSSVAARTLSHGTAVGSLPTPTRKGFRFMGWFLPSGTQLSTSTLITADTTVTARWTSTNAKLKSIKPSTGKLNRKFAASRTAYTLPLSRKKSRVTITASPAHSKAKVEFRINKKWKKANSQTVRLSRGSSQTVKIRVTAEDKQTVRTYTVKVTRAR